MKMAAINNIGTGDYHEYADMETLNFDPVFIPEVSIKQGEGGQRGEPVQDRGNQCEQSILLNTSSY